MGLICVAAMILGLFFEVPNLRLRLLMQDADSMVIRFGTPDAHASYYLLDRKLTRDITHSILRDTSPVWGHHVASTSSVAVFLIDEQGHCLCCCRLMGGYATPNSARETLKRLGRGGSPLSETQVLKRIAGDFPIAVRKFKDN